MDRTTEAAPLRTSANSVLWGNTPFAVQNHVSDKYFFTCDCADVCPTYSTSSSLRELSFRECHPYSHSVETYKLYAVHGVTSSTTRHEFFCTTHFIFDTSIKFQVMCASSPRTTASAPTPHLSRTSRATPSTPVRTSANLSRTPAARGTTTTSTTSACAT